MKKFVDYVKLREVSATSIGKDILGGSSSLGLDSRTEAALQAVIESFELLLDARPNMVISWLKRTSSSIPEVAGQVEQILAQHDFESLPDLKGAVRRAGRKISGAIKKGLGDEGVDGTNDVLSPSAADSFKGEAYFIETAAVCARCGKEGRASKFDINAGKAKCRECGGYMHQAEPKPRKKKASEPVVAKEPSVTESSIPAGTRLLGGFNAELSSSYFMQLRSGHWAAHGGSGKVYVSVKKYRKGEKPERFKYETARSATPDEAAEYGRMLEDYMDHIRGDKSEFDDEM